MRCFKSDSIEYNFQNYPCDSTWLITNANNFESNEIEIQPNPTNGKIKVYGIGSNSTYILINLQGQIVSSGNFSNGEIEIPYIGVFLLKIKNNNSYFTKKIYRL
ncbi:MAG: T9SS type A sorting domain-containing protein [Saprospiraceae bacterium]|nr:T9SS type A sorting domain-containing protein [Candidatus Vicinibacter affinis]